MGDISLSVNTLIYIQVPILVLYVLLTTLRWLLLGMTQQPINPKIESIRRSCQLRRLDLLRKNSTCLTSDAYGARRDFYAKPTIGFLHNPPKKVTFWTSMQDYDNATSATFVKHQVSYHFMQCFYGYLFNHLFSGHVAAVVPFPLPFEFKNILQVEIAVPNLATGYISALAWYFFVLASIAGAVEMYKYLLKSKVFLRAVACLTDERNSIGVKLENEYVSFKNIFNSFTGGSTRNYAGEIEMLNAVKNIGTDYSCPEVMALSILAQEMKD